jgi:hypothetical protein
LGAEHPVVERLAVVGVGARPQQPPGERNGVRMRRLPGPVGREHPGEHGERRGQAEEEPAVVRVGTRVQQQLRRGEGGRQVDVRIVPGVRLVQQR